MARISSRDVHSQNPTKYRHGMILNHQEPNEDLRASLVQILPDLYCILHQARESADHAVPLATDPAFESDRRGAVGTLTRFMALNGFVSRFGSEVGSSNKRGLSLVHHVRLGIGFRVGTHQEDGRIANEDRKDRSETSPTHHFLMGEDMFGDPGVTRLCVGVIPDPVDMSDCRPVVAQYEEGEFCWAREIRMPAFHGWHDAADSLDRGEQLEAVLAPLKTTPRLFG